MAYDTRAEHHGSLVPVIWRAGPNLIAASSHVALLGALWLSYSWVRRIRASDVDVAFANAYTILDVQRALGFPSERALQLAVLDSTWIVRLSNLYYLAHFPATVAFLVWVGVRHRSMFSMVQLAFIVTTAVGLVVHLLYPLAPPRMLAGYVDTAKVFGPSPYDLEIAESANQLAAMPSLHVGWALLLALGVLRVGSGKWRLIVLLHPIATLLVVVVTANHFWIDAIVAAAIVGVAWAGAGVCSGHKAVFEQDRDL